MTQPNIHGTEVLCLLSAITLAQSEVCFIMQQGRLVLSGKIQTIENQIRINITDLPDAILQDIDANDQVTAIAFLNEEKISWNSVGLQLFNLKDPTGDQRWLCFDAPLAITKTLGRKEPRNLLKSPKTTLKINGHPNPFPLIDVSPGGCSFSAPSHLSKTWTTAAYIDFEIQTEELKLKHKLKIVRTSFEMNSETPYDSVVSCKFENPNFGKKITDSSSF